jgi:hypothetical protein
MQHPQSHVAVIDIGPSLRFDGSATPILYLAVASAGASEADLVWQIVKYDTTSGVSALHPFGSDDARFAWSQRATYPYS